MGWKKLFSWKKLVLKKRFLRRTMACALACILCLSGCGAGTPDQDMEKEISGADPAQPTLSPQPMTWEEWEEYYNAPMPGQVIPEGREVITLGTLERVKASSYKYQAVNAFNQAQEKYFVSIQIYDDYDRFLIDIAGKKGTDLYDLDRGVRVEPLIEKGVLEDLTPYFEGSAVAGKEDMVDAVWRAGSTEDKLYCLIPSFKCTGLLVEKGYTKDGAWSGRDFLDLGKKYPGSMLCEFIQTPGRIINSQLREYMAAFIDWEAMTCSFDGDEFIALLEDLKALASSQYEAVEESATKADLIRGKSYLTELMLLGMDSGMHSYRSIKDAFGSGYEFAGMPTADGSLKYELFYNQIYGINSASQNKEGAWAFLEYLVSEEYQQPGGLLPGGYFPARKDLLERELQADVDHVADSDGEYAHNPYTGERIDVYGGITEEDKQAILRVIDSSYRTTFGSDPVPNSVICEEAEPFFQGQKSARDVANIIQSKIALHLAE